MEYEWQFTTINEILIFVILHPSQRCHAAAAWSSQLALMDQAVPWRQRKLSSSLRWLNALGLRGRGKSQIFGHFSGNKQFHTVFLVDDLAEF
jgi:hypothetical protein